MSHFADRLLEQVARKNNPTVLGLDATIENIPKHIRDESDRKTSSPAESAARSIFVFNAALIDAVADIIPAVKPQSAYYELYGPAGVRAFSETIAYARSRGLLVIADGKRNDIGSTAQAYASAYLGQTAFPDGLSAALFNADALTVNAYLGKDGIDPFLKVCADEGKGIFILVRTSNPSAGDFQDIRTESGDPFYQLVGDKVAEWGKALVGASGYSSVGAVVGATWPEQASGLRARMPGVPFLVPGYGAQGATAEDVVHSFDEQGRGAVVNASRSLMYAYKRREGYADTDFDQACRDEALTMRDALRSALTARTDKNNGT